jgi:glucose-6-phosphate 1-epimerase
MIPSIEPGINGLPKIRIQSADGASAEIYLHGAHVTSWKTPDGVERLYLSKRAVFQEGKAIRGGVPICFPQFAELGDLPKHGFARTMDWELANITDNDDQTVTASFMFSSNNATLALWSHDFDAHYNVTLGDYWLLFTLMILNTGFEPLSFTGALHTYLSIQHIGDTWIEGLQSASYLDKPDYNLPKVQTELEVRFSAETDSVYLNAPSEVVMRQVTESLHVRKTGFPDIVIWNVWHGVADLADMELEDYKRYVCIEAAAVTPITIPSGGSWVGGQRLRVK